MGEASMERAATTEETADIAKLLAQAVDAGAYGFTSTLLPQHVGYQGRPLASQLASRDELAAYCHVLRDAGRGSIEVALTRAPGMITDEECETLDFLLTESRSKVTWLALLQRDDAPEACQQSLKRAGPLIARGGVPQITCRPLTVQVDMRTPFVFADRAVWKPAYNRTPQEQMALYGSSGFRDAVREDFKTPGLFCNRWDRVSVKEVVNPALKGFEGRRLDELALESDKDGLAVMLDIAIQDGLETQFSIELFNADESRIPELLRDPRTMLGLSDGGAHVDMLCDAGYATHLLGHWVRNQKVMSLEQAVARLTSEPADFLGIRRRGRLARGMAADIAVFDPATVGSGAPTMRHDLPGGGRRLVVESRGVEYTVVNGAVAFERGRCVDATMGQVLRSGMS
jgi:N-acyl-D-aspartate/D-glutamate deacylase